MQFRHNTWAQKRIDEQARTFNQGLEQQKADQTFQADQAKTQAYRDVGMKPESPGAEPAPFDLPSPPAIGGAGGGLTVSTDQKPLGAQSPSGGGAANPIDLDIMKNDFGMDTSGINTQAGVRAANDAANNELYDSMQAFADGGPVFGPPGDDQVPAEMPDGSPARLSDGEYVLPKEYVIGLAKKSLGKKGDMLSPEKLHALGVDLLDGEVAQYTGRQPGAKLAPPLPGQEGMVPAMADGHGLKLSKYGQQGGQWTPPPDPTLYNGVPLESTGGVPITRQGSEQSRMLSEQGMNNTLTLSPGAFRDARTLYMRTAAPIDTRRTGAPQVPSNVLPKSMERAKAAQRPVPPTRDLATRPMPRVSAQDLDYLSDPKPGQYTYGPGEKIPVDTGIRGRDSQGQMKKIWRGEGFEGEPAFSDSFYGATKQGLEEAFANGNYVGDPVTGQGLSLGKGPLPKDVGGTELMLSGYGPARESMAAESDLRAMQRYNRPLGLGERRAPLPDHIADDWNMPRRGESKAAKTMRDLWDEWERVDLQESIEATKGMGKWAQQDRRSPPVRNPSGNGKPTIERYHHIMGDASPVVLSAMSQFYEQALPDWVQSGRDPQMLFQLIPGMLPRDAMGEGMTIAEIGDYIGKNMQRYMLQ